MGVAGLVLGALLFSSAARAQPVPFSDRAPAIDHDRGVLSTAAIGLADERLGSLSARRDTARASARARAISALHRFADDALARARAAPACATSVHRAIDAEAQTEASRPLADGSVVLIVSVSLARLAAACSVAGLPWRP